MFLHMCAIFKISLEEISYAHQSGIYLIKILQIVLQFKTHFYLKVCLIYIHLCEQYLFDTFCKIINALSLKLNLMHLYCFWSNKLSLGIRDFSLKHNNIKNNYLKLSTVLCVCVSIYIYIYIYIRQID